MTPLEYTAQALEITSGLVLIARLFSLKLYEEYRVFCYYLIADLLGTVLWFVQSFSGDAALAVDYRILFVLQSIPVCILVIAAVYELLHSALRSYPGILRKGRTMLLGTFAGAAAIGLASMALEYHNSGFGRFGEWQDLLVFGMMLVSRVVSSIVLLAIVSMLCFLFWFPVEIPRNLAVIVVGFTIYSAGTTFALLVQSLLVHDLSRLVSTSLAFLNSGCYLYWAFSIRTSKTRRQTTFRKNLDREEQARLIRHLEKLNDSLLHSVSHPGAR